MIYLIGSHSLDRILFAGPEDWDDWDDHEIVGIPEDSKVNYK